MHTQLGALRFAFSDRITVCLKSYLKKSQVEWFNGFKNIYVR